MRPKIRWARGCNWIIIIITKYPKNVRLGKTAWVRLWQSRDSPNRKIDDGHHNFSVCRVSGRTLQSVRRWGCGHQRLAAVVRIPSWGPSRTPGTGNRAVNHSGDAPDVDFRNESLTSVVSAVPGCAEARKTSFAGRAEAPVSAWCRWCAAKCTREVLLPGVAPEPPESPGAGPRGGQ